jgi:hypothetical protein
MTRLQDYAPWAPACNQPQCGTTNIIGFCENTESSVRKSRNHETPPYLRT